MCSDGVTSNHTSRRFDSILVIYLPTDDLVPLKCQSDIRYYTVEYDTSQISVLIPYISIGQQTTHAAPHHMMTSWIGNIFRVTGHCAGNSPIPNEFPAQRPVTRSFDVFFDLRLNKRLSKQSRGWWFETPPLPLWRHRNDKNYSNGSRSAMLLIGSLLVVFSCDQAALQMVFSVCLSVRPSVCPSVCPSVRHTFLTMFPSSYHHEIFRSY